MVAENETASDMAIQAAEKFFTEHDIDRSTIDYLLFCTQSPDYFFAYFGMSYSGAIEFAD